MKIAFIVRPNLYTIAGGDTVQIDQTAKKLRELGVEVNIYLSTSEINYQQYNLLNFFHLTRPAAILWHSSKTTVPFVLSTIYCPYGEYDKYQQKGLRKIFAGFSEDTKDYLRIISRWMRGRERIPFNYIWVGQRRSIIKVLDKTSCILPNSQSEFSRIIKCYPAKVKCALITNGVNPERFPYDDTIKKDDKLIICVGRIEHRKNQLNLIKALNNTPYTLALIGAPSPNQPGYYQQCREAAAENIKFLDRLPHEQMLGYYQKAKVHVLASWFETTGLSSLEAAVMRCNIVVTEKGDTKEYFAADAFYCDPASPQSIKKAVDAASSAVFNPSLLNRVLTMHTWQIAAEQTLQAYQEVLSGY